MDRDPENEHEKNEFSFQRVHIAVGDDDGIARVFSYDPSSHNVKCTYSMQPPSGTNALTPQSNQPFHTLGITSICWNASPMDDINQDEDAKVGHRLRVLTSSKDGTCKIWQPWHESGTPQVKSFLDKHTNYVNMACWQTKKARGTANSAFVGSQTVLTCSDDATAKLWDATTGELKHTLQTVGTGHNTNVSMATFSPDGSKILTCGHDSICIIWRTKDGHHSKILPMSYAKDSAKNHVEPIWSALFDMDGHKVLTASMDCTARVWDSNTCQQILTLSANDVQSSTPKSHKEAVFGAVWNQHDTRGCEVLTCSLDGTAKVWDTRSGNCEWVINNHKASVWTAAYGNTSDKEILTTSHDMTAIVHDKKIRRPKHILSCHTGILWQATYSPDDRYVVTCSDDTSARLWDLMSTDRDAFKQQEGSLAKTPPSYRLMDTQQPCRAAVNCAAFNPMRAQIFPSQLI